MKLTKQSNSLALKLIWIHDPEIAVELKRSCFKQNRITFIHRSAVNLFIAYKSDMWSRDLHTDFTLGNFLSVWSH